jgi:hypothetical protein
MPVSLSLMNDIYYYWASPNAGVITLEARQRIRGLVYELARETFRTDADLIRVCHQPAQYALYHLIFPPEDDDNPLNFRGEQYRNWFGPMILEALRREPTLFVLQVAHLISDTTRLVNKSLLKNWSLGSFSGVF